MLTLKLDVDGLVLEMDHHMIQDVSWRTFDVCILNRNRSRIISRERERALYLLLRLLFEVVDVITVDVDVSLALDDGSTDLPSFLMRL